MSGETKGYNPDAESNTFEMAKAAYREKWGVNFDDSQAGYEKMIRLINTPGGVEKAQQMGEDYKDLLRLEKTHKETYGETEDEDLKAAA